MDNQEYLEKLYLDKESKKMGFSINYVDAQCILLLVDKKAVYSADCVKDCSNFAVFIKAYMLGFDAGHLNGYKQYVEVA